LSNQSIKTAPEFRAAPTENTETAGDFYDLFSEDLRDPLIAALYLDACIRAEPAEFLEALRDVERAWGGLTEMVRIIAVQVAARAHAEQPAWRFDPSRFSRELTPDERALFELMRCETLSPHS
jgi:hypothetical protein